MPAATRDPEPTRHAIHGVFQSWVRLRDHPYEARELLQQAANQLLQDLPDEVRRAVYWINPYIRLRMESEKRGFLPALVWAICRDLNAFTVGPGTDENQVRGLFRDGRPPGPSSEREEEVEGIWGNEWTARRMAGSEAIGRKSSVDLSIDDTLSWVRNVLADGKPWCDGEYTHLLHPQIDAVQRWTEGDVSSLGVFVMATRWEDVQPKLEPPLRHLLEQFSAALFAWALQCESLEKQRFEAASKEAVSLVKHLAEVQPRLDSFHRKMAGTATEMVLRFRRASTFFPVNGTPYFSDWVFNHRWEDPSLFNDEGHKHFVRQCACIVAAYAGCPVPDQNTAWPERDVDLSTWLREDQDKRGLVKHLYLLNPLFQQLTESWIASQAVPEEVRRDSKPLTGLFQLLRELFHEPIKYEADSYLSAAQLALWFVGAGGSRESINELMAHHPGRRVRSNGRDWELLGLLEALLREALEKSGTAVEVHLRTANAIAYQQCSRDFLNDVSQYLLSAGPTRPQSSLPATIWELRQRQVDIQCEEELLVCL